MAGTLIYGRLHEQEKEIVNILIDSELYLDMDLRERLLLLHQIVRSFYRTSKR